jgi:uncharacterized coiled-coil protein SlyX
MDSRSAWRISQRAKKTQARIAELEARVAELESKIGAYNALLALDRAMCAPPGHVLVSLLRKDVEHWKDPYCSTQDWEEGRYERMMAACRKALEVDDE